VGLDVSVAVDIAAPHDLVAADLDGGGLVGLVNKRRHAMASPFAT
jgi:hypothetical protein